MGPNAVAEAVVDREDEQLVGSKSEGSELRSHTRLVYSANIIALGKGSARVLKASDISSGGLRAETHPHAAVGDELRIAIPLPGERVPLIARARVVRNQGELALAFEDLPPSSRERLHRRLEFLPEEESSFSEEEEPARVIVSEIR